MEKKQVLISAFLFVIVTLIAYIILALLFNISEGTAVVLAILLGIGSEFLYNILKKNNAKR
ncbi:hypothetical protein [Alkalihalobacillus sp. LMS39]|uniref:hypothetical protein n=1 Tax=Alkalihalobacillus sp. LMS39 TaxID=2924032 RepID=UPI001FB27C40|nr:hypothetical protein [Alkalihalobacillus sp. LMS39]UOE93182.1 hypothetical protein MM271_18540 [Alkalihalobacillus sp. LMS39]